MRDKVINTITEKFKIDKNIFFLLGDLGIFQARFANQFDNFRCINYGIMEQSMLGFASGISKAGAYPIVYSIAPFLVERSFEQLKIDFGYNEAKGLIITAGGSFDYNKLGPTHYCPNDISLIYKTNCRKIFLPWNEEDAHQATVKILNEKNYSYLRLSSENIIPKEKPIDINNYDQSKKEIINIGIGPDSLLLAKFMGYQLDLSIQVLNADIFKKISDFAIKTNKINLFAGFNLDFIGEALTTSLNYNKSNIDKKSIITLYYSLNSKFDTSESKLTHLTSCIKSFNLLI